MPSDGASSISVTVRVRPFTIREAAQLTKCDDSTIFLGDGSLAAAPTPKLSQKGLRPVIKVVDDKCLYVVGHFIEALISADISTEYSTLQKTIPFRSSLDPSFLPANESKIKHLVSTESSTKMHPRVRCTRPQQDHCWTMFLMDIMPPSSPMVQPAVERHILLPERFNNRASSS